MGESIMVMRQRKKVNIQSLVGLDRILESEKKKTPKMTKYNNNNKNKKNKTRTRITTTTQQTNMQHAYNPNNH